MIRIVGQAELHERGTVTKDWRVWRTPCGIHYLLDRWPRLLPRPSLPRHTPCEPS